MTGERWQRVRALFEAAVEQPAGERTAFLATATAHDEELRREVESLLEADQHWYAARAREHRHMGIGASLGERHAAAVPRDLQKS